MQPLVLGGGRATGAVVPPAPLGGATNRGPDYPWASRIRGEEGVVRVLIQVGGDGRVTGVRVLESSGFPALDEAALAAVRRWRFRPAQRDGVPMDGSLRTAIHFRLQGGDR